MAVALGVFSQAWVILAFSATLLLPVLGMTIDAPRSSAIHRLATKLAAEGDAPGIPAELRRRIYDPVLGTWNVTGTVLTLWMLFLMTLKPGWLVGLSGLAVTLVLGLALSLRVWLTAAPPVNAA
jgi:hypothetical protein